MPRLHETGPDLQTLQVAFGRSVRSRGENSASALLSSASVDGDRTEPFGAGIEVYRNNAWQFFLSALERTYTVVQRRVGADFFRQLAHEYRDQHPSRCGDLHWIGAAFPAWLAHRLAGTGYDWLAELARLEWACEEAATAACFEPVGVETLGHFDPDCVPDLTLVLQPSLCLVASAFPLWSVWQSNQDESTAPPVDLDSGSEQCVVACVDDRVAVYRLDPDDYRLLQYLCDGRSFTEATAAASTDATTLGRLLAWAFGERLVVQVVSPSAPV